MTNPSITSLDSSELKQRIVRFQQVESEILTQVRRVIVGQEEVLEQVLIALFVGGHCLITGLPGTANLTGPSAVASCEASRWFPASRSKA